MIPHSSLRKTQNSKVINMRKKSISEMRRNCQEYEIENRVCHDPIYLLFARHNRAYVLKSSM